MRALPDAFGIAVRASLADWRKGYEGRQIRNEFFCFEAPRKTSNAKENDSRLLPDGGEPRRATSSRGETRKESKEAVRVCETFSAAMYAASARVANPVHLYELGRVRVKILQWCEHVQRREHARTREYKVLFSKFMIVNKF